MRHLFIILIIISHFSCKTNLENTESKLQEYEPIAVEWEANSKDENNETIKKSREFLKEQDIDFFTIYHNSNIHAYTLDSIPYAYSKIGDSITYFLNGSNTPMNNNEIIDLLKNENSMSFYINNIYSDGRFDVASLYEYSILKKGRSLYYIWTDSKFSNEEWVELYTKRFDALENNDIILAKSIEKKLDESEFLNYDLVFNIDKLSKKGNTLKTSQRKIELIDTFEKNGKKYFHLSSTAKKNNEIDIFHDYIIDENLEFIKIRNYVFEDYK